MSMSPDVTGFFDPATNTITYLVADLASRQAAVIDPVLDFEPSSGRTATLTADTVLAAAAARGLGIAWVLETHIHADHMTAAAYIKAKTGASTAIGAAVVDVQNYFGALFNVAATLSDHGGDFDRLLADRDTVKIGDLDLLAISTPGHTPACMTYVVGDAAFVGDTIFMPDYGTARCDFPGGDAAILYRSIRRILDLPPDTRIFVGHDYGPDGRPVQWQSSVAAERRDNIHVREGIAESEFTAMRTARDKTLKLPTLILPAVQINLRAGRMPPPESNGVSYVKIPINRM